jgi:tRNA pseudouridine55 synthase
MDGVIVVDKPAGWTSHDVVNRLRRLTDTRKVGHLGTLDPAATGVLPMVVGRATRLAQFFSRGDKTYDGTIRFGHSTDTYDAEGTLSSPHVDVQFDAGEIEQALSNFRGIISQVPPPVSAKKIGGVPAYKFARKNQPVELKPVQVEIYSIELLRCGGTEIEVRIHCSPGTYVRGIAHDLGQALGCGAWLETLRRTASGGFDLAMARTLEDLGQLAPEGRMGDALIPCADLLPEFPIEQVDSATAGFIRQGRDFRVSPFRPQLDAQFVKAISPEGDLIAIGQAKLPHLYHPVLVL